MREDLPPDFDYQCAAGNPAYYETSDHYHAIVYDYVSDSGEQDLNTTKVNIDFFNRAGFSLRMWKRSNWRQGKLVDFGDLKMAFDHTPPLRGFEDFKPKRNFSTFFPAGTKVPPLVGGDEIAIPSRTEDVGAAAAADGG